MWLLKESWFCLFLGRFGVSSPLEGGGCYCLLLGKERMTQVCLSSGELMGGGEKRQGKVVLPAPERVGWLQVLGRLLL